jgi:small GTP-binding protein
MAASIKIVVVGAAGSGKSSLIARYTRGTFDESVQPTVGSLCVQHEYASPKGRAHVAIWDTAGQERTRAAVPPYYFRGADAVILAVEQADEASFEVMERHWLPMAQKQMRVDNKYFVLCITKIDKRRRNDDMQRRLQLFAARSGIRVVETSALTGENVELSFASLIDLVLHSPPENHTAGRMSGGRLSAPKGSLIREPIPMDDESVSQEASPGKEASAVGSAAALDKRHGDKATDENLSRKGIDAAHANRNAERAADATMASKSCMSCVVS